MTNKKFKLKNYLILNNVKNNDKEIQFNLGYFPPISRSFTTDKSFLYLLSLLSGDRTLLEIQNEVKRKFSYVNNHEVETAIKILLKERLIEENINNSTLSEKEVERYSRHLLYYSMFSNEKYKIQQSLKDSKVTLIGMGGIGCWCSLELASAGIGHIVGVDADYIESSNLTRQILYTEKDIGRYKVDIAKEKLKEHNSFTKFTPIKKMVNSTEDVMEVIKGSDFVILSGDKPEDIHSWVNSACLELNIPYSNVGYIEHFAICGPMVIPGQTSCHFCHNMEEDAIVNEHSDEPFINKMLQSYQAPSFGPANGFISSFQIMEVIKYLGNFYKPATINKRYVFDTLKMRGTFTTFKKNDECPICNVKEKETI